MQKLRIFQKNVFRLYFDFGGNIFYFAKFSRLHELKTESNSLVGLVYSEDVKKYGLNTILKYIVPDLHVLENQGIRIKGGNIIRDTICCIVHYNLGGNAFLGCHESFNSNYYTEYIARQKRKPRFYLSTPK